MFKRVLLLLLLTLGLCLLMGLMAAGGAEAPPPRPPVLTSLPPVDACLAHEPAGSPAPSRAMLAPCQETMPDGPVADANGMPVCMASYHLSNYLPFCFSDRAG